MKTKQCTKCKEFLPFSEFYKNNVGKFGLGYTCRKCIKKYNKSSKAKEIHKKYRESANGRAKFKTWRKSPRGKVYRLREAMNRYYRNQKWINELKVKLGCVDCGFNRWPESLDFDHKNRSDKAFSISQRLLRSKKTLLKEIDKCVVRCANCHRYKTKKEILK